LPSNPATIPDALENFVIHHAIARQMGIGVPERAEPDRNLRTVERIVSALVERDDRPLTEHRHISNYLYGTCHDFALLATGTLRHYGVPARLRVGYAGYFNPGKWEYHWVCEYRRGGRWALLDGQLGPIARDGFKVKFPVDAMSAGGVAFRRMDVAGNPGWHHRRKYLRHQLRGYPGPAVRRLGGTARRGGACRD
jgi:hypothetical protein